MAGAGTQAFRSEPEMNSFDLLQSSATDVDAAEALLCNALKSNQNQDLHLRESSTQASDEEVKPISSNSTATVISSVLKLIG